MIMRERLTQAKLLRPFEIATNKQVLKFMPGALRKFSLVLEFMVFFMMHDAVHSSLALQGTGLSAAYYRAVSSLLPSQAVASELCHLARPSRRARAVFQACFETTEEETRPHETCMW